MNKNDILEEQFVQRAYDGNWEKIVKILDHENAYRFKNEAGIETTHTPEKWLTVGVFSAMMEFV